MQLKIIFDLRSTGLGNNGGSATLIKSGNTLSELGVDVLFLDSGSNMHTWNKLNCKHIILKDGMKIPQADFIIATGYKSVAHTLTSPKECGKKCHWIRAWETWRMSEGEIVKRILHVPTLKFVNSICLQNKLKQYGVDSTIVRPGYDTKEIYPFEKPVKDQYGEFILGGIFENKHNDRKRTAWVFEASKYMKSKYPNIKLWMFGNRESPKQADWYYIRPSKIQKNHFYNKINIWLAPTQSEGLHMPPAEAMLTECPVVGTNAELSGMQDYLFHEKTGLVSENNLNDFIKQVERLYNDEPLRKYLGQKARFTILDTIGCRKDAMDKFLNILGNIK
jgi:glycosyltransferase involved in cell wall biosynthesis